MRVRNRILQLYRASRLEFGSAPLGPEDQRRLASLCPELLRRIADPEIFEFVWRDSKIEIDEADVVYYPVVEEWEWAEAMTCPVPHPHIWIETAVAGPEGDRDRIYIWDVVRDQDGVFTATPVVFDQVANLFSFFGTHIVVDQNGIDDLGRRGAVTVIDDLERYDDGYRFEEFHEQANMLVRFLRILCQPKVIIEAEPADDRVNRERHRRGREAIAHRRTVRISEDAFQYQAAKTASGTHASPQEHHRRAHKRRYADGRETDVRECVVNRGLGPAPLLPQTFSVN